MNLEAARAALKEAQSTLENTPCSGVVGSEGPSLEKLVEIGEAGDCHGGDSMSHDAQWAWRKIEEALKHLEP